LNDPIPTERDKKMSTYLLLHGAWHGAWCWQKVTPLLELAGHTVIAPDLPGSGSDLTPLAAVTFASYVQCITDALDALPPDETIILLGHGTSGMVISQVAEERAERLSLLVYLSALLPKDGETALQITAREPNPRLEACLKIDDLSVRLLPDKAGDVLYQDCEWTDRHHALRYLTPQPLLPLTTPVTLTERFWRVPRVYLTCRYDLVASASLQSQMYGEIPCERVIWLMTGHAPFLSAPDRLAARLIGIARLQQEQERRRCVPIADQHPK
jgi:pimeloyl-ACP methyl ester carboxylesterase